MSSGSIRSRAGRRAIVAQVCPLTHSDTPNMDDKCCIAIVRSLWGLAAEPTPLRVHRRKLTALIALAVTDKNA